MTQTTLTASTPRLFGTDGIRGAFGAFPLDQATVVRLGGALGRRLNRSALPSGESAAVVMGGDTRDSTPTLASWLAAGLASAAVDCRFMGVVPTPAVARACATSAATCGVAISASHNLHPDNGIKLMGGDGFKWPSADEAELERELAETPPLPPSAAELAVDPPAALEYVEAVARTLPGESPLAGLEIVVDAGNGAASAFAEELLRRLGARVYLHHAAPDGRNINQGCGSTHPEVLCALVQQHAADLGFAFDGDADRVILADSQGQIRDGDAILFAWARALAKDGALRGNKVVATSMSNLGLEVALRREGLELVRCEVGDRAVVETLKREDLVLGGEQSGHIVNLDLATTGDGLLTAVHMAHLLRRSGKSLSDLLAGFERFPQVLLNVPVREKVPFENLARVRSVQKKVEGELGTDGRLVLRYSGTEALARVMIEGRKLEWVEALAGELVRAIEEEIGAA